MRGGLLGGLCAVLVLEALEIVALDRVAYKDFMESMKLVLGAELALCSDPGPADPLVEVSLKKFPSKSQLQFKHKQKLEL